MCVGAMSPPPFPALTLIGFGTLNKLLLITPAPMPNLITYGLVLALMAGLCALFTGLSLQISTLSKSVTHVQSQLGELRQRTNAEQVRPAREAREDTPVRSSR